MTVPDYLSYAGQMLRSIQGLCRLALPDKLDWRPCESVMTLGQCMEHTASSLTPLVEMAVTKHFPPPEFMDVVTQGEHLKNVTAEEAVAIAEKHMARLGDILDDVTPERWENEKVTMPWGFTGSLSMIGVEALDHASGHRYQLFLYLKLLGLPLDTGHLYGMHS
jgi:hypothetical protein